MENNGIKNDGSQDERARKEQEICNLTCDLQASISAGVGDYQMVRFIDKIVTSDKFWELFGDLDLPKTRAEITAVATQREAKRNRIRELQRELDEE